jgi:PAS domain S-box-containing protein
MEAALRESAEVFRAIFENAHDGILLADSETKKFHFGNDMICRMLGYDKEELKDVGVLDIHPEEDLPDVMEKFKKIARNELALTKGIRVRRKDRSIFYADIGASPLKLNGKDYVIGIFRDVTELIKAEEEKERLMLELRDALERVSGAQKEWQDTFDNITDLVSIHDIDFNIIKINKAFSEYFGSPEKVINRKCYQVFHTCNMPVPNCPHKKTLSDCINATEEVHDPKTGRTFRVSTFPYYATDGSLFGSIHIARDITAEREREMHLIMTERLATLGQMASGIAHEINNPLAFIAGCAEGLLNKVKKGKFEPETFEKYLNIIEEEILRCKNITSNMLSFARKSPCEKREINMNEMLDRTLEVISFQGRLGEVRTIRKYSETAPIYYGNEGEVRQVVLAIIINALDAMDDKGTLTLETGTLPASLSGTDVNEGGSVFIKISDTGPGIPQENIERIFKPFFTTKSEKGGTGLGLCIAQKIISRQNGDISFSTEEGKGSSFRITLRTEAAA